MAKLDSKDNVIKLLDQIKNGIITTPAPSLKETSGFAQNDEDPENFDKGLSKYSSNVS